MGPSALMHHTVILPAGFGSGSQVQVPFALGPTDCCSHNFFLKERKMAFLHVVNLVIFPNLKVLSIFWKQKDSWNILSDAPLHKATFTAPTPYLNRREGEENTG